VRDLAELRDQPVDALAAAATRNAQRVFRLADQPQP
jgi:TatD DNase family protein